MLSFIVPAHNEAAGLGATLRAIHNSARATCKPYEVVVADDASTDATAEIARQHDARVVSVNHRQIAATRNSGARAAQGEFFFFVDADTHVNPRAVTAALRAMERGAVGGGGATRVPRGEVIPLYARLLLLAGLFLPKLIGFTGGAFMFCTRAAYERTGGFDEKLFWSEEGAFAVALKRQGRFFVPWQPVETSGRRLRTVSGWALLVGILRIALSPVKTFTRRESVKKIWYDSDRSKDNHSPREWPVQLGNGLMLVLMLLLFTGPMWNFIPAGAPLHTFAGMGRLVITVSLCHVALAFWPIAGLLLYNLFRQRPGREWLRLSLLIAFCVWRAWVATRAVIWFWPWLFQQLKSHA